MSEEAEVHIKGEARGALEALDSIKEHIEGLSSPIHELMEAFTGIGEAVLAAFAVEKIEEWSHEIAEAGAKLVHLSQETGLAAEEINTFGYAAKAMGESTEAAGMGFVRLERNMVQAQKGTGRAADAFKAVGIPLADLKNMKPEEALEKIADAFAKHADGPEKTAIAMALMGRTGMKMIPILNQGAAGIRKFGDEAKEVGYDAFGKLAEDMEDTALKFNKLEQAGEGLSANVFAILKPLIDSVVTGFTSLSVAIVNSVRDGGVLGTVLKGIVAGFQLISEGVSRAYAAMADLASGFGSLTPVINELYAIFEVLKGVFMEIAGAVGEILSSLMSELSASVGGLNGVIAMLVPLLQAFKDVIVQLTPAITGLVAVVGVLLEVLGPVLVGIIRQTIENLKIFVALAVVTIRVFAEVLVLLKAGAETCFEAVIYWVKRTATEVVMDAKIMNDAFHLDWSGIKRDWQQGLDDLDQLAREHAATQERIARESRTAIGNILHPRAASDIPPSGAPEEEKKEEGPEKEKFEGAEGSGEKENIMAEWQKELDRKLMAEKDFGAKAKTVEEEFWREKLKIAEDGGEKYAKAYDSILKKVYGFENEAYGKDLKAQETALDAQEKASQSHMAMEKTTLQEGVDAKILTESAKEAIVKQMEQEEYQLQLDTLNKKIELYKDDADKVKEFQGKIEELNQEHLAKMQASDEAYFKAQQKELNEAVQSWQDALNPLADALDKVLMNAITRKEKLGALMKSLGTSLVSDFISGWTKDLEKDLATSLADSMGGAKGVLGGILPSSMIGGDKDQPLIASNASLKQSIDALTNKFSTAGSGGLPGQGGVAGAPAPEDPNAIAISQLQDPLQQVTDGLENHGGIMQFLSQVMGLNTLATLANTVATWVEAGASALLPGFASGSWHVPHNMTARIHAGEMIVPAGAAAQLRSEFSRPGGTSVSHGPTATMHQHNHFYGGQSGGYKDEAALLRGVGQSGARAMVRGLTK